MPQPQKQSSSGFRSGVILFGVIVAVVILVSALKNQRPSSPQTVSQGGAGGPSQFTASESGSVTSPTIASPISSVPVTAQDEAHLKTLEQIFLSKNDNDPRLDTDFKSLSPGTKYLLKQKYQSLKPEARNEKGTIVFLIGRDLSKSGQPEDFTFLNQVAAEAPCLSLSDCGKESHGGPEDSHEESTIGVTLAYPQFVLLHSLQSYLQAASPPPLAPDAARTLEVLSHSQTPAIASNAQKLAKQISPRQ